MKCFTATPRHQPTNVSTMHTYFVRTGTSSSPVPHANSPFSISTSPDNATSKKNQKHGSIKCALSPVWQLIHQSLQNSAANLHADIFNKITKLKVATIFQIL